MSGKYAESGFSLAALGDVIEEFVFRRERRRVHRILDELEEDRDC